MGSSIDTTPADDKRTAAHTVRLPKFLVKDTVGLGQNRGELPNQLECNPVDPARSAQLT